MYHGHETLYRHYYELRHSHQAKYFIEGCDKPFNFEIAPNLWLLEKVQLFQWRPARVGIKEEHIIQHSREFHFPSGYFAN